MAPIFVPPTPSGELAARLRKIATTEAEAGVNFRIVETGGRSMKRLFQCSRCLIQWRQQDVTTATAYHVGLVVEMVGDILVLEQTIPWNASNAQMDQRAATLVKPQEIFTLEALNMRRTIEVAVQIHLCASIS